MSKDVFNVFRFLEAILVILGTFGSLTFWARTRFWLPRYIHVLAAIGLMVGVLSVWASPADAPIKREGLVDCLRVVNARPPGNHLRLLYPPRWAPARSVQPLFVKIGSMPVL